MKKTILLMDDDRDFVAMLSTYLRLKDYTVIEAYHSQELPHKFQGIDLVLLDINLPNQDGFEVCRQIRRSSNVPIVFVSARCHETDRIRGLMLGGDDYITKPFSLEELAARIYTNVHRMDRTSPSDYKLDPASYSLRTVWGNVSFTKTEYDIVELLMIHQGQVLTKDWIWEQLWGYDSQASPQVIAEHVRNIRNKLKQSQAEELIATVWGIGYKWVG